MQKKSKWTPSSDVTYASTSAASSLAGEDNDCAVKAISIATKSKYDFVRGMLHYGGRVPRQGTPQSVTVATLKKLGYTADDVSLEAFRSKTVAAVVGKLDSKGVFLVRVKGHIFCVNKGRIEDYSGNEKKRVLEVIRVARMQCSVCGVYTERLFLGPPADWPDVPKSVRSFMLASYHALSMLCAKGSTKTVCLPCAKLAWKCESESEVIGIPCVGEPY